MSKEMTQILAQIETLSQTERAELAYAFVCSLDPVEETGVEEAWRNELRRRVGEIHSGTAQGRPTHEVFAELRAVRR